MTQAASARAYVHPMDRVLENIWVHLHRFIKHRDEVAGTVTYYTWSDDQEQAFLDYMWTAAPSLYGNDWITHTTRVCALWGWGRTLLCQPKRWRRRSGKTLSEVAFVAAYLMCTADAESVHIYTPCPRVAARFIQQVYDMIKLSAFYMEGRIMACTQGGDTPTISVASLLVPGVIVSAHAHSYDYYGYIEVGLCACDAYDHPPDKSTLDNLLSALDSMQLAVIDTAAGADATVKERKSA